VLPHGWAPSSEVGEEYQIHFQPDLEQSWEPKSLTFQKGTVLIQLQKLISFKEAIQLLNTTNQRCISRNDINLWSAH